MWVDSDPWSPVTMTTDSATAAPRPLPLKGWLVNKGILPSELAERTGFARVHVIRVLNRRVRLSRDFALAIAREFNLGMEECEVLMGRPVDWAPGWPPSRRNAVADNLTALPAAS